MILQVNSNADMEGNLKSYNEEIWGFGAPAKLMYSGDFQSHNTAENSISLSY